MVDVAFGQRMAAALFLTKQYATKQYGLSSTQTHTDKRATVVQTRSDQRHSACKLMDSTVFASPVHTTLI